MHISQVLEQDDDFIAELETLCAQFPPAPMHAPISGHARRSRGKAAQAAAAAVATAATPTERIDSGTCKLVELCDTWPLLLCRAYT
jgi:hypothetical protein